MAKVVVITRTKDRPIFLQRALQSIANQSFRDFEHVVVNDGGDASVVDKIIAKLPATQQELTQVVHNPKSVGMDAATNQILRQTQSELIAIHDDDDSWHPDFLAKLVAKLADSPQSFAGVISHSVKIEEEIVGEQLVEKRRAPFNTDINALTLLDLTYENRFPPISFLYKRSALERVGYYREDVAVLADWDFNLRFLANYDIAVVPEALANYHQRVGLKQGSGANTIHGSVDKYIQYEAMIRNGYMRQDIESGKIGLGFWLNVGRFLTLNEKQNLKLLALSEAQHRWLTKLKTNPVVKLIRGVR